MTNYQGEELTIFLYYDGPPPIAEVADILAALDDAVRRFHADLGTDGTSLVIREVRMGSVKFWLGLAGVALPAAKLEADHPGTLTQFLELLKTGVIVTADSAIPAYIRNLLGLCAKPVIEQRAKEVVLGNPYDEQRAVIINTANAVTIINHYYPSSHGRGDSPTKLPVQTLASQEVEQPTLAALSAGATDPSRQHEQPISEMMEHRSKDPAAVPEQDGKSHSRNVEWSIYEGSTRDVLLGLSLDVGEQTGVIVGRDILRMAFGRPDIGDAVTSEMEKARFEAAVRHALVSQRPFDRTRFNDRALAAMRLEADDFKS